MDERMKRLEEIAERHAQMHVENQLRMASFEHKLDLNTRDTQDIKKGVSSMIETMAAWNGAMTVVGWLAKPFTAILTLVGIATGIYFAFFPKK